MSKPRYNGASPCRGVTYEWFSFISFVNVAGEWPSQKALNKKETERRKEKCHTANTERGHSQKRQEDIIKEQRDLVDFREREGNNGKRMAELLEDN